MTRSTRKALFYILVVVFFIVGAAIILYAEGWRVDLATFKAEKVGAIYVRSFPSSASISIDGKPVQNQSGFLSQGTFVSNLFPKNYDVSLSEQGYDAWDENAEVLPSLVAELKYAVLVPTSASIITTSTPVTGFFESDGDIVAQTASDTIMWRGKMIGAGMIVSHSTNFDDMIMGNASGTNYLFYDFTDGETADLTSLLLRTDAETSISDIVIDPYQSGTVIAETKSRIWTIDPAAGTVLPIAVAPLGTVTEGPLAISPTFIAWSEYNEASGTSGIAVYDTFAQGLRSNTIAIPGTIANIAWISNDTLGILLSNGALYRYSVSSNNFQKIADDVKSFYSSADGAMVAALEAQSVEIFSLNDSAAYYRFNLPAIAAVQSLAWYKDDNHLFVAYPDHLSFLDLADVGLHNFITISANTFGNAYSYDVQANTLYLINAQQELTRFNFPS